MREGQVGWGQWRGWVVVGVPRVGGGPGVAAWGVGGRVGLVVRGQEVRIML